MRNVLTALVTGVGIALLVSGAAVADSITTTFEPPFTTGSVDGQFGWHSRGVPPALPGGYDQEVVSNTGAPAAFGAQSLRHSNAYNEPTGEFENQTYSSPTAQPAGEDLPNQEYTAQFSFLSVKPDKQQPGLFMSLSPDNSHGGRMSYIGLEDTQDGVEVSLWDTPLVGGKLDWRWHYIATVTRDRPHTIKVWMKLNPGPDNDLLGVSLDNVDVGECFTTWENFYPRVPEPVPVSNSLLFLSRPAGNEMLNTSLAGGGYLFDNVTVATGNGLVGTASCGAEGGTPAPPDDVDIDKTTSTRFARPGDRVTYRITVRNRGENTAHGLRVCDRAPRSLVFVGATERLRRASGRRRCLAIPLLRAGHRETLRATFRVSANVTAGVLDNEAIVDTILASTPPLTSPPQGAASLPGRVVGSTPRRRRLARRAARIRIVRALACPAAKGPRAHAAC